MDSAQRLLLATRQGLPLPRGGTLAPEDLGLLLISTFRVRLTPPLGIILDLVTHLMPIDLDVQGNASHWAIRTMDAALDRTIDRWLERFDSQDEWNERYVTRMVLGWQDYPSPTFVSRHGHRPDAMRLKHQKRAQDAWQKARDNWTFAFRDEAEHFYDKMLKGAQYYEKDTQFYLSCVGLGVRDYIGPFAMSLLALCGNQRILDHLGRNTRITFLDFPAPPIISFSLRKLFAQDLLEVLNRDVYLQLILNETTPANDRLDAVLSSYLGFDYAAPPSSYIHVEPAPGGWQLHTHIEGAPSALPPIAHDFHVPVPRIPVPPASAPVLDDLFFYGEAQTWPIALATMELTFEFHPDFFVQVNIRRSDTTPGLVDFHLRQRTPMQLPLLPPGITWQVQLFSEGITGITPAVSFVGRLWFTDIEGNESNHAFWSIAGQFLTAIPFTTRQLFVLPLPITHVLVDDWFAHVTQGNFPLTVLHVQLEVVVSGDRGVFLLLKRSDDVGEGLEITNPLFKVYDLPVLPAGVTWQLTTVIPLSFPPFTTLIVGGTFWVEDSSGAISNHAAWRAFINIAL